MERREWRFSDESAAGRRQVMSHEEWMEQSSVTATSRQERATQKRIRAQRSALVEITSAHAAKREIGIKRILKKRHKRESRVAASDTIIKRPKLEVFVICCRHLPKMDMFGRADGYVVVSVGDVEQKTKVITRNYNPVYQQKFIFDVPPLTDELTMEVFDWDMVGSDDFIGMVSEPLLSAQTKSEEVIRKVLVNDERKFKREACVKFKLRWLPEDYDEAQEAIQRGSRKSLDSNQRSSRVSFDDDGLPTKIPRSQRPWKCQRCKFSENPPTAQACEACERNRKEAEIPVRSSFEILANFFGFYRTKSRDSRGSMSSRWSRSSRGSVDTAPDSDDDDENQEPEETEDQLKARLRKEANLRQYSRSAEERERAAQGAISDMFELAEEDEKTRKKRRYREARIAAGKDPDKQDADDLQKALQERKEKAAKGLSAVKQKFRKAVLGTGVALVAFANDMKDAMWKEDAF